ncbi:dihydropyrimidinase [Cinnamomum micranthum f. kanehirae]|uniref:dihydropyrimidinase n=1 Tax=Cinnamomum micranthum f. kanehirae TaxID=337451 RepID=A0A443N8F6_9MAGN|nr:dihydropyrimidinase [Cinnamomum micranthum f. kanehirae]
MAPMRAWRETAADRKPKTPTIETLNRFDLFSKLSIFLLISLATSESHQIPEFCDAGYVDSSCVSSQQSNSKILIKGGTVVNAHSQEVADVYIEDGIIASVRPNIVVGDDVTVLDATGKYVMPGGIDPHTHMEMEFMGTATIDDFFSGQAAALAGGTTMHIDFVIPVKGSLTMGLESYSHKAKKACMDYGFHMAVTKWDEVVSREMELMVSEKGINSFKFFMAYKGALMISDELLLQGLDKCKSLGALAMVHAENGDAVAEGQTKMINLGITGPEGHALSRPPVLEAEATARAIHLAGFVNTPLYIVHVMSIDAMEEIAQARKRGQRVIGEPVVSGLDMLKPFKLPLQEEFCSARIFNIYPRKGAILEGSDADIIILNPNSSFEIAAHSHHSKLDTNVFEGRRGKGKVEVTISRGRVVWKDGELKVEPGYGRYIKMPPFSYLFDGIDKVDAAYFTSLRAPVQRSFCDAGYVDSSCVSSQQSNSKILIKGGTVVNAHNREVADVYIEDGIIASVRPNIVVGDDVTVLDATGKYVMPGGIDPHTHMEIEAGAVAVDDFFSGQAAALAGGTTMHIDFVIPVNGSLTMGLESYSHKAKKACMDYGFHMVITKWDEVVSREMELMVSEKGINSFKFFMAYKGAVMIDDELLLQGLDKCKSLGALAMVHAENGDAVAEGQTKMINLGITGPEGHALSRPPVLEAEATARAIHLAAFVNTPLYIVHVMSIDAMEEIAKARKRGQRVIGEPVVSGLLVGTDHCAHNSTQKALGIGDFRKIPNGVNGVEERMHLIWDSMVESGKISVNDYVRITSTECARIFNIYPRKGAILEGSDADIIILNPNSSFEIAAHSHHSKSDTNVYEGWRGKGKVEVTISRGRVVWKDGELKVEPGYGRYSPSQFNIIYSKLSEISRAHLIPANSSLEASQAAKNLSSRLQEISDHIREKPHEFRQSYPS